LLKAAHTKIFFFIIEAAPAPYFYGLLAAILKCFPFGSHSKRFNKNGIKMSAQYIKGINGRNIWYY